MSDQPASMSRRDYRTRRNSVSEPEILEARHVALFALLLPALLLTLFAAGHGTLPGDVYILRLVQDSFPSSLGWLTKAVNAIGSTLGAIVISIAVSATLIVRGNRAAGVLLLATLVVRPLNEFLKLAADSPRPEPGQVEIIELANGLGFPSGHTSGAVLFYGALFYLAPQISDSPRVIRGIRIGSILMMALMGLSRIHAGAHWPSDVIGGYLWGAVALFALIILWQVARRRFRRRRHANA